MSEEKLYAVKNDEGIYWDFLDSSGFCSLYSSDCPTTTSKDQAELVADEQGAHVVTLVEEPEKVAVSPNEAQAIKSLLNANTYADVYDPFKYLFTSRYKKDIKRLTEAIKNGYTVKKEKKYNVKVPKEWSGDDKHYWTKEQNGAMTWAWLINKGYMIPTQQFTLSEIEHYGLQDCEKEEVTDDEQ